MHDVLITGCPGFVGSRLLAALAAARPHRRFALVVEERFVEAATALCQRITAQLPGFAERWAVLPGDIRQPDLGIAQVDADRLRSTLRQVWHVAAIYDLAVPESLARAVNVDGTARVLDFCESATGLERLLHVSSIVTAGGREGTVLESELDEQQRFRNHYESTKFESERIVRLRSAKTPTVIFRPAVVVGDSRTGETPKADGPYLMVRAMQRTPAWLPYAHVGTEVSRMNIVPVDWLVDAMVHIAERDDATGKTFHLADPEPMNLRDFVDLTLATLGRRPASVVVSKPSVERALRWSVVRKLAGIPLESLAYIDQDITFDVSHTRAALEGVLPFPKVAEYWPRLVRWVVAHPEL